MSPKKFLSMLRDTSVASGPKTVPFVAALTTKTQLRARGTEAVSEPSCAEKPTSSAIVKPLLWRHYHGEHQFGAKKEVCPTGGNGMAEPLRVETAPRYAELKNLRFAEEREGVIDACYELLCSGRPLEEILAEVKRLSEPSNASKSEALGERSNAQAVDFANGTQSAQYEQKTAHLAEPRPSSDQDHRGTSGLFEVCTGFDEAHSDDLRVHQLPETTHVEEVSSIRRGLIRRSRLLVLAAICFPVLATTAATALFAYLPNAEATASTGTDALEASQSKPVPSIAERPPASTPSAEHASAAPDISSEQIQALRARGDALVSMADVSSGRLFYERAAAAGDSQAALRLGATYDPSFLARAGLKSVRGDPTVAIYWYRHARDLGANEAEILLKSIEIK
jgi:hypothetical protein